jgi:hypothetical protein
MEEKLIFRSSFKYPFPTHQESSILKTVQEDMAETLSATQSEISLEQIASPEKNRHNFLVRNPFHAYDDSLVR